MDSGISPAAGATDAGPLGVRARGQSLILSDRAGRDVALVLPHPDIPPGERAELARVLAAAHLLRAAVEATRAWIEGSSPGDLRYTALLDLWAQLDAALDAAGAA